MFDKIDLRAATSKIKITAANEEKSVMQICCGLYEFWFKGKKGWHNVIRFMRFPDDFYSFEAADLKFVFDKFVMFV